MPLRSGQEPLKETVLIWLSGLAFFVFVLIPIARLLLSLIGS